MYYVAMCEDLEMNDIRTFNYGFEFQSPKYVDTCQVGVCDNARKYISILATKLS